MKLPEFLKISIEKESEGVSLRSLSLSFKKLSEKYRHNNKKGQAFISSSEDALAYLLTRLPATFGAISKVLLQVRELGVSIETLLDLGSGPGTTLFAADQIFSLKKATLVEKELGLINLAKKLMAPIEGVYRNNLKNRDFDKKGSQNLHAERGTIAERQGQSENANSEINPTPSKTDPSSYFGIDCHWVRKDLEGKWEFEPHDLVMMAYSLGELSQESRPSVLKNLWCSTEKLAVLIEPGTPLGFQRILEAREILISLGAHLLAPCPHQNRCPLGEREWCHFSQRIERSSLHRLTKEAELGFEDEKFSYLIFSKQDLKKEGARVIAHPRKRSGHIHLKLCSSSGITHKIISRKNKHLYSDSKNSEWGSLLNLNSDDL